MGEGGGEGIHFVGVDGENRMSSMDNLVYMSSVSIEPFKI